MDRKYIYSIIGIIGASSLYIVSSFVREKIKKDVKDVVKDVSKEVKRNFKEIIENEDIKTYIKVHEMFFESKMITSLSEKMYSSIEKRKGKILSEEEMDMILKEFLQFQNIVLIEQMRRIFTENRDDISNSLSRSLYRIKFLTEHKQE